jgi:hypothetical protein
MHEGSTTLNNKDLDARGFVHHSTILTEKKPNKMQQCIKILLFLILNEAQHVSGDTPPIIRSLKLHKQPLVLHTWKALGTCSCWTLSGGVRYLTTSNNNLPRMQNQRLLVQFQVPDDGRCVARNMLSFV